MTSIGLDSRLENYLERYDLINDPLYALRISLLYDKGVEMNSEVNHKMAVATSSLVKTIIHSSGLVMAGVPREDVMNILGDIIDNNRLPPVFFHIANSVTRTYEDCIKTEPDLQKRQHKMAMLHAAYLIGSNLDPEAYLRKMEETFRYVDYVSRIIDSAKLN